MKRILLIVTLATLCAGAATAQQQQEKKTGLAEWLKSLRNKIARIVPEKTVPVSNGVAGVRGAKEDSQVKLYWRGKKGEDAVSEDELTKFKAGVDLAEKGDRDGALKDLDDFMKQYPDSALIPDAKKTLDLVKAMPKPGPNEEKTDVTVEQKLVEKKEGSKAEIKEDKKAEQK